MLGLGIVALLTSVVPIRGVSAAIAASIPSIPRIGDSEMRPGPTVGEARPSVEGGHRQMEEVVPAAGAVRVRNVQKSRQ